MKKVLFNIILLLSIYSFCNAQPETYDSDLFLATGNELFSNEKYEESITYFSKVDELDPNYLDAIVEMTYSLAALEKTDEALAQLQKLYDDNRFGESPNLFVVYGALLGEVEKFEESEKIYEEGLKLYPHYSDLIFNAGILKYQREDFQGAVDLFKDAITINPNAARSHFMLAAIALESGRIAEGCLGLMGYLANTPRHEIAQNAVMALSVKMSQSYLDEKDVVFSKEGDDFDELTTILRSQIALNKNYTLKCEIDEIYTRHAQALMEYASEHEGREGFFEKHYIPFLAEIYNLGLSEEFIYFTLIGSNEEIQKQLKKQKKKIEHFSEVYYDTKFWKTFASRKMEHFGEMTDVVVYLDDDYPYLLTPVVDGLQHGKCRYIDKYGRTKTIGAYDKGLASGDTKYYNSESKLIEESFFENGDNNGAFKTYYSNDKISSTGNYTKGVVDVEFTSYYVNGGISCINKVKDGEYNGTSECFHENGQKSLTVNYKNGSFDGPRISYRADGSKELVENFVDGKLNGELIRYDENGNVLSKIMYKDDKPTNSYDILDKNGKVSFHFEIDGKNIKETSYESDEISSITLYNDWKIEQIDYYEKGVKYLEEKYDGDDLKSAKQFTYEDQKGKKLDLKNHSITNLEGVKVGDRHFVNGQSSKDLIFYHLNGKIKTKSTYASEGGVVEVEIYDKYGRIESKYSLKDDNLEGEYLTYEGGILASKNNYKKGVLNGPFWSYYPNGDVERKGFNREGAILGKAYNFDREGNKTKEETYIDNELSAVSAFEDGHELVPFNFVDKTGEFTLWKDGKNNFSEISLVNGIYEGEFVVKNNIGETIYKTNYLNGKRHGDVSIYYPSGELSFEGHLKFGLYDGVSKYYDHLGHLYVDALNVDNVEQGSQKRYYVDGSIKSISTYQNDARIGLTPYFNLEGDTLMILNYDNGMITGFQYMENGKLGDMTKITSKSYVIEGSYSNGKPAVKAEIKNKLFDNQFILYQVSGEEICRTEYKDNILNGDRKEYYKNGNLYISEEFRDGDFNGKVELFDSDGTIRIRCYYDDDELEGDYEIYDKGKLIKTKTYKNNVLVSTQ